MSQKKKHHTSPLAVILGVICLVLIVLTNMVNHLFSGESMAQVGNYYLYLNESSELEPYISANSLVIAKDSGETSVQPGYKVLCYLSDGSLALRDIYAITVNDDNSSNYYPGTAVEQGSELAISREDIIAICSLQSGFAYYYIIFANTTSGVMALVVIPAILLIAILLVTLTRRAPLDMDDEEFLFTEGENDDVKQVANPLFDPSTVGSEDSTREQKKTSVSEFFEQKQVDINSPYQKAVQERTMRFKIQQENIEEAKRIQAERERAREEARANTTAESIIETVTSVRQELDTSSYAAPIVEEEYTRTESPNIDDILRPGELEAAKHGYRANSKMASVDSIDALISMLEKEKENL